MNWERLNPAIRLGSFACLLGCATLFLFGSSRIVHQFLPESILAILGQRTPLLLFLLLMLALCLSALRQIILVKKTAPRAEAPVPLAHPRWAIYLHLALSLFIFSRALYEGAFTPFDWDENSHTARLASPQPLGAILPHTSHSNHSLASTLSYVSMKIFGVSKYSARLPSLILTGIFLVLFFFISQRSFSPWASLLILGNFVMSPLITWGFHSMRGYISLLLFSFLCFSIVYELTKGNLEKRSSLFAFCFLGATLSHGFGGFFCVVLSFSLLVWLFLSRKNLSGPALDKGLGLLGVSIALLPVVAWLSAAIARDLSTHNWIARQETLAWEPLYNLIRMGLVLGLHFLWELKLVLLLSLTLGYFHYRKKPLDFPAVFLLSLVFVFAAVRILLGVSYLEGRYLVPFLCPFFIWIVGIVPEKTPARQMSLAALVLLFVAFPSQVKQEAVDPLYSYWKDQERFVEETRQAISTRPITCLSYSGDAHAVEHAKYFHFHGFPAGEDCPFHLSFSIGPHQALHQMRKPADENDSIPREGYAELLNDGHGRKLYSLSHSGS